MFRFAARRLFSTSVSEAATFRRATAKFDPKAPVADADLQAVLEVAQTTPSSFNFEPYRAVVVRDASVRKTLAQCMLGGNSRRVEDAPVTVVVLADTEAMRDADGVIQRSKESGMAAEDAEREAFLASMFAGGALGKAGDALRLGSAALASLVSSMSVPTPQPAEVWASKHAGIYGGFLLLAAASRGLATAPMEGYDAHRLRAALGVPSRFSVTMVVAMGHSAGDEARQRPVRRALSETVSLDGFGLPWPSSNDDDNDGNDDANDGSGDAESTDDDEKLDTPVLTAPSSSTISAS